MVGKIDLTRPGQPLPKPQVARHVTRKAEEASFATLLEKQVASGGVKFSRHAQERLASRNIRLRPEDLARINSAVEKAAQKGARDSLVLMDDLALVVSVKNRTVVTAVDGSHLKENVFTNIDSAVII
ncbi:TIGR02530 family flagellar biosynthesis protein [Calderihabitans maritimus]|uniref:Flagellar operon protein n=1 Tax=Calderihabitans maritimus TaxID=1246530 RepID=A0A1Z5HTQ7_9FIRM|nr:TIGR02530 family flagellar biosynthesis protein [Calderihabitans maritimus]GAW92923.1 flagellar operon protein [Calderihabitans maritimus]